VDETSFCLPLRVLFAPVQSGLHASLISFEKGIKSFRPAVTIAILPFQTRWRSSLDRSPAIGVDGCPYRIRADLKVPTEPFIGNMTAW
jgi:hypothetical protein